MTDTLQDINIQFQKQAAESEALDAEIKLTKLDIDTQSEAQKLKGRDAVRAIDVANDRWNAGVGEINAGLHSPFAKKLVDIKTKYHYMNVYKGVHAHMAGENVKMEVDNTDELLETKQSHAGLNFNNPKLIQEDLNSQMVSVDRLAKIMGWSKDKLQSKQAEAISNTHVSVINSAIARGDENRARTYFEENINGIEATKAKSIAKELESESLDAKAQENAVKIFNGVRSADVAASAINRIKDKKERDRTQDFYKELIVEQNINYNENESAVADFINKNTTDSKIITAKLKEIEGGIGGDFFNVASEGIKKLGQHKNNNKFISLLNEYSNINTEYDPIKRIDKLRAFRTSVFANAEYLDKDQFKRLVSWSVNGTIDQAKPTAQTTQAGVKFINNYFSLSYGGVSGMVENMQAQALTDFLIKAMQSKNSEDVQKAAQEEVKKNALQREPDLIGKDDLTNMSIRKGQSANALYPGITKGKGDYSVKRSKSEVKPGMVFTRNGATYVAELDSKGEIKMKQVS